MRPPKPLVVRAGLTRTFGSIACFVALGLLSVGIYLLADAFAHPVDAEAAGVIVAAFAIALAIRLLAFLLKPRRNREVLRHRAVEEFVPGGGSAVPSSLAVKTRPNDLRLDLPYQHAYVDRSRIRPCAPDGFKPAESPGNIALPESRGGGFDVPR